MAAPDRQGLPDTHRSEQVVLNKSFDEDFDVLAEEQLGYDGQQLVRQRANASAVRYDASGGYVGYAAAGSPTSSPVWQITKLDLSSGVVVTFANGSSDYNQIWDNRASLSYS